MTDWKLVDSKHNIFCNLDLFRNQPLGEPTGSELELSRNRSQNRMTGIIKSLPENKPFGFIKGPEGEYFFHREDFNGFWADLQTDFRNKQTITVEFKKVESLKGLRASDVKRITWPD